MVASGWGRQRAAGCVLWEEHGNVEYDAKTEQTVCNVRGTCAARACAKGARMKERGVGPAKYCN